MHSALVLASCVAMPVVAQAQVFDPLRGYGFDGTPVQGGPRPGAEEPREPRGAPTYVSSTAIRRSAAHHGFKLTDQPHRRGRSFMAVGEDERGRRFRLVFNAFSAQLVDRTDLTVTQAKAVETPAPAAPAKAPEPIEAKTAEPLDKTKTSSIAIPTVPASVPTKPVEAPTQTAAIAAPVVLAPKSEVAVIPVVVPPSAAPTPAVPTPATPPASYAAVNPCEIPALNAAPQSTAAVAPIVQPPMSVAPTALPRTAAVAPEPAPAPILPVPVAPVEPTPTLATPAEKPAVTAKTTGDEGAASLVPAPVTVVAPPASPAEATSPAATPPESAASATGLSAAPSEPHPASGDAAPKLDGGEPADAPKPDEKP